MNINIFVMGGANAERLRESITQLREGGVTPRERRLIRIRQEYARESPTMVQLQFMTIQNPTPQYYLPCDIPSSSDCDTTIAGPSEVDATTLAWCNARISFGQDPDRRPRYREIRLEIPARGIDNSQVVEFNGTGIPAVNTFVEGVLHQYQH
ncbi:MAG TPA: hypothetical protein DCE18_18960 [Syntrophobacteraceae bacterium]|jgi:hypothetical protein|nr:hypothetical protein [Syntrophobacteraceae bacterium]HBZ56893.1 hypothetical protein [Syntrophobacteraceae bacterium]